MLGECTQLSSDRLLNAMRIGSKPMLRMLPSTVVVISRLTRLRRQRRGGWWRGATGDLIARGASVTDNVLESTAVGGSRRGRSVESGPSLGSSGCHGWISWIHHRRNPTIAGVTCPLQAASEAQAKGRLSLWPLEARGEDRYDRLRLEPKWLLRSALCEGEEGSPAADADAEQASSVRQPAARRTPGRVAAQRSAASGPGAGSRSTDAQGLPASQGVTTFAS